MLDNELSSFGDWELKKRLGTGGFGEVLLWKHRRSNQEVATKRCLRDRDLMHDDEVAKLKERWWQEYKWMHDVKTQYIVRGIDLDDADFVAYLNQMHGAWRPLPVILMEYCNGGDVRHELLKVSNCNGLPEFEVRQIMHALRHAIEYLHIQCKIEHRDLKPDNIVIQCTGKEKIYKLTDFGFGCQVLEQTTQASIVGTSNYIAPEILDTSHYTKTVDYWSLGIIAFELMCGVLPFVPHQSIFHKITNIRVKPNNCIAIIENPSQSAQFKFESKLFPENRMSSTFQLKMEEWLRLALNTNFRLRGSISCNNKNNQPTRELKIFTLLDEILECKILTVFCLNTFQFYSYEVRADMNMTELLEALERDTRIPRTTFFVILPTGHPHVKLTAQTQPMDLYVSAWMNNTVDSGNPPAMLYLLSYQGDYNAKQPHISPLIQYCLELSNTAATTQPTWVQQQLAVQTHFLIASEQRHLETLLGALYEYALTIEHEIFLFETTAQHMTEQILFAGGTVRQFNTMVQQARIACEQKVSNGSSFFASWDTKITGLNAKMHKIQLLNVRKRYNSAYKRIKKQATNSYFKDYINKDIYQLNQFRKQITEWQHYPEVYNILNICKDAVYNCLEQRNKFLTSQHLADVRTDIAAIHEEFIMINKIASEAQNYLLTFDSHLVEETAIFQQQLLDNYTPHAKLDFRLSQQMNSLSMEGDKNNSNNQQLNSYNNAATSSLDEILQLPSTEQLLDDTRQQMSLFEMMYDEDLSALPVTINMD